MQFDWFPLGLATGKAFCNRKEQRKLLMENYELVRHSLLISPRRYGKTSLVAQSIVDTKCISTKVDFFSSTNLEAAQQRILDGIGELIPQVIGKAEKAVRWSKDFFKRFHISVQYKDVGFSLGIKPVERDPAKIILDALIGLDAVAAKAGKKVVLFFDEFQIISLLDNNILIEGAIREAAQQSRNIAYVFSGSNRHLLAQLFEDRSRPLYLLCQRVSVERILADEYSKHLNKAAKEQWDRNLDKNVIECILQITERHPYYINALCGRLWRADEPPTSDNVVKYWSQYSNEEKSRVSAELELLPLNQRKLLVYIARAGVIHEPTSQSFLGMIGLSGASVLQSITALVKKDYLEKLTDNGGYRIIDPMIKSLLADS